MCIFKCLFIYFVVLNKSKNKNNNNNSGSGKKNESGVSITPNKILINGNMVMVVDSNSCIAYPSFVTVKNVQ